MKTMQEAWREYRDKVYPKGISVIQNRETHQAYFAGAADLMVLWNELSKLPEDQAVAELGKLSAEIMSVLQFRNETLKARN